MGIVDLIEHSTFATFVRESPSLLGYTTFLSLHAMGLAVVAGLSTVVSLRLLGLMPSIPVRPLRKLFPLMYIGFWVNALSGLALFAANLSGLLENTMFYAKMVFIVFAVVWMIRLRRQVFSDEALSAVVSAPAAVPAGARSLAIWSLVFWSAALVAGRMTAYPYFMQSWFGI
jgi:hypothetical protein